MILGLKYIQVAGENGLSRVYVAIGVECRYLENALQIADATIASKLLTISVTHSAQTHDPVVIAEEHSE